MIGVALVVGAAAGSELTRRYLRWAWGFTDLFVLAQSAEAVSLARERGTESGYERALLDYAKLLKDRTDHAAPELHEGMIVTDLALTYARLARLKRRLGDSEASTGFDRLAASLCPRVLWKHCSAEELEAVTLRLDSPRRSEEEPAPIVGAGPAN